MKILHIHPSMTSGGIEAMISALANEMAKKEDVTVCSIFKPTSNDIFWSRLTPCVKKITLGKMKSGFSISTIFKIFNTIRTGHFDVVNMHGMFYYYVLPVLLFHKKIKFFYTVHSDAKKENTSWDKKLFFVKKYCFVKGFIHPITISKTSQKSFSDLYQCSSKLIFNGVIKPELTNDDLLQGYRLTEKTKIFIHVGRISTPKNQLVLCKVFKRLIDEGNDVVLLIVGAKQMENIFQNIKPYFCERIVYLGERNDILQLMAHCDAMCLPSIWEGLPITLIEALSVGCIPICSSVGGIPDVILDGENGLLSKSCSEEDFFFTVKRYLSLTDKQCKYIICNCLKSFSKYNIRNTAEEYLKYYDYFK